jgi:hypothetical protein
MDESNPKHLNNENLAVQADIIANQLKVDGDIFAHDVIQEIISRLLNYQDTLIEIDFMAQKLDKYIDIENSFDQYEDIYEDDEDDDETYEDDK